MIVLVFGVPDALLQARRRTDASTFHCKHEWKSERWFYHALTDNTRRRQTNDFCASSFPRRANRGIMPRNESSCLFSETWWLERRLLRWALQLLSRSHCFPSVFFIHHTLANTLTIAIDCSRSKQDFLRRHSRKNPRIFCEIHPYVYATSKLLYVHHLLFGFGCYHATTIHSERDFRTRVQLEKHHTHQSHL